MKNSKNLLKKAFRCVAFLVVAVAAVSCSGDIYESTARNTSNSFEADLTVEGEMTTRAVLTFTQLAEVVMYDVEKFSTEDNNAYVTVELAEEYVANDIEPLITETSVDENTTMYSIEKVKYVTLEDGQVVKITYGYSYIEFTLTTTGEVLRYQYVKITDVAVDEINWSSVAGQEYDQEIPVVVSYMEVAETTSSSVDESTVDAYPTLTSNISVAYTKVSEVEPEPEPEPEPVVTTKILYTPSTSWDSNTDGTVYQVKATVVKTEVTYEDGVEVKREDIETSSKTLNFKFSISEYSGNVADFTTSSYDYEYTSTLKSSTSVDSEDGNWSKTTVTEQYLNTFSNGVEQDGVSFEHTIVKGKLVFNDGAEEFTFDYNYTPEFSYTLGEEVDGYRPLVYSFGGVISSEDNVVYDCIYTYNLHLR